MSKQSRLESLVEASLNTASGFVLASMLTVIFSYVPNDFLYLGDGLTPLEIILWTSMMTAVSIIRSYVWRRMFANEVHNMVKRWFRK